MFDTRSVRFDTRKAAEETLATLQDTIDREGFVSVKVLKCCTINPVDIFDYDSGLGWRMVDAADVCQIGDQWYIRLPSPEPVENLYIRP